MLRTLNAASLSSQRVRAQQIGENAPAGDNTPATFSASSQLVVETVNVKDKSGKPVDGLTAKDFTVTEDGVPQDDSPLRISESARGSRHQRRRSQSRPRHSGSSPKRRIAAEQPGDIRYQDRRLLVFYFDMTAMPPQDQLRAIKQRRKFIRTQMTPADRVALMRFEGGSVRVASDFTG